MILFPVVDRELRVAARQSKTYRDRAWMAAVFVGLAALIVLGPGQSIPRQELGKMLFATMGAVAVFAALLFGPVLSADSLSSEKREGTLGLLFLTDLKAWQIIAGKLASHGVGVSYQFLGALPVIAIPLLVGGITWNEYARMAVAVLNAIFFSLTAGYFISAHSEKQRSAIVGTTLLIAFFAAVIPMLDSWADLRNPFFSLASPAVSAMLVNGRGVRVSLFWDSVAIVHLLGWLWLALACIALPRTWKAKAPTVKQVRFRERLTRWSLGDPSQRSAYRAKMLDRNPVCWLDDRYRLQKSVLWGTLLGAITWWSMEFNHSPSGTISQDSVIFTVLAFHYSLVLWIAFNAPQRFSEDRTSGAMELLLVTPFTVREIVGGRWLTLRRQFGWVVGVILIADILLFVASLLMMMVYTWRSQKQLNLWILMGLSGTAMFLLNVFATGWTGLWFGLTSRKAIQATGKTLAAVCGVHWIVFMLAMAVAFKLDTLNMIDFEPEHALGIWFVIGLINCGFWILWSRRKLLNQFRFTVNEPRPVPWWSRIFARLFKKSA